MSKKKIELTPGLDVDAILESMATKLQRREYFNYRWGQNRFC